MYTRCSTTCKTLLLLLLLLLSLYYPITIIRRFSTCPPVSTYSEYACPPYGRYLRITRPRAPSSISGYVPTTCIPELFKHPRIIRPRKRYTTSPQKKVEELKIRRSRRLPTRLKNSQELRSSKFPPLCNDYQIVASFKSSQQPRI